MAEQLVFNNSNQNIPPVGTNRRWIILAVVGVVVAIVMVVIVLLMNNKKDSTDTLESDNQTNGLGDAIVTDSVDVNIDQQVTSSNQDNININYQFNSEEEEQKFLADNPITDLPPDSDNDGLSDGLESMFGTNPNSPDTDSDGYLDGDEVNNGYNPLGGGRGIKLFP